MKVSEDDWSPSAVGTLRDGGCDQVDVVLGAAARMRRNDEHEFPDRTLTVRYRFVHVLYQNVLFGSLQPTRRAQLSGRTARALAARRCESASSREMIFSHASTSWSMAATRW